MNRFFARSVLILLIIISGTIPHTAQALFEESRQKLGSMFAYGPKSAEDDSQEAIKNVAALRKIYVEEGLLDVAINTFQEMVQQNAARDKKFNVRIKATPDQEEEDILYSLKQLRRPDEYIQPIDLNELLIRLKKVCRYLNPEYTNRTGLTISNGIRREKSIGEIERDIAETRKKMGTARLQDFTTLNQASSTLAALKTELTKTRTFFNTVLSSLYGLELTNLEGEKKGIRRKQVLLNIDAKKSDRDEDDELASFSIMYKYATQFAQKLDSLKEWEKGITEKVLLFAEGQMLENQPFDQTKLTAWIKNVLNHDLKKRFPDTSSLKGKWYNITKPEKIASSIKTAEVAAAFKRLEKKLREGQEYINIFAKKTYFFGQKDTPNPAWPDTLKLAINSYRDRALLAGFGIIAARMAVNDIYTKSEKGILELLAAADVSETDVAWTSWQQQSDLRSTIEKTRRIYKKKESSSAIEVAKTKLQTQWRANPSKQEAIRSKCTSLLISVAIPLYVKYRDIITKNPAVAWDKTGEAETTAHKEFKRAKQAYHNFLAAIKYAQGQEYDYDQSVGKPNTLANLLDVLDPEIEAQQTPTRKIGVKFEDTETAVNTGATAADAITSIDLFTASDDDAEWEKQRAEVKKQLAALFNTAINWLGFTNLTTNQQDCLTKINEYLRGKPLAQLPDLKNYLLAINAAIIKNPSTSASKTTRTLIETSKDANIITYRTALNGLYVILKQYADDTAVRGLTGDSQETQKNFIVLCSQVLALSTLKPDFLKSRITHVAHSANTRQTILDDANELLLRLKRGNVSLRQKFVGNFFTPYNLEVKHAQREVRDVSESNEAAFNRYVGSYETIIDNISQQLTTSGTVIMWDLIKEVLSGSRSYSGAKTDFDNYLTKLFNQYHRSGGFYLNVTDFISRVKKVADQIQYINTQKNYTILDIDAFKTLNNFLSSILFSITKQRKAPPASATTAVAASPVSSGSGAASIASASEEESDAEFAALQAELEGEQATASTPGAATVGAVASIGLTAAVATDPFSSTEDGYVRRRIAEFENRTQQQQPASQNATRSRRTSSIGTRVGAGSGAGDDPFASSTDGATEPESPTSPTSATSARSAAMAGQGHGAGAGSGADQMPAQDDVFASTSASSAPRPGTRVSGPVGADSGTGGQQSDASLTETADAEHQARAKLFAQIQARRSDQADTGSTSPAKSALASTGGTATIRPQRIAARAAGQGVGAGSGTGVGEELITLQAESQATGLNKLALQTIGGRGASRDSYEGTLSSVGELLNDITSVEISFTNNLPTPKTQEEPIATLYTSDISNGETITFYLQYKSNTRPDPIVETIVAQASLEQMKTNKKLILEYRKKLSSTVTNAKKVATITQLQDTNPESEQFDD